MIHSIGLAICFSQFGNLIPWFGNPIPLVWKCCFMSGTWQKKEKKTKTTAQKVGSTTPFLCSLKESCSRWMNGANKRIKMRIYTFFLNFNSPHSNTMKESRKAAVHHKHNTNPMNHSYITTAWLVKPIIKPRERIFKRDVCFFFLHLNPWSCVNLWIQDV